jgi:hypothetical protein
VTRPGIAGIAVCLLILILSSVVWAQVEEPPLDANKPVVNGKIPPTDRSCWEASAANMMAADDWVRNGIGALDGQALADQIFTDLRKASGIPIRGGGTFYPGGYQNQAITYYNNKYKLDLNEAVDVWSSWNRPSWRYGVPGRGITKWDDSPRTLIDNLLATQTSIPPPEPEGAEPLNEGPDDPIGIGFQSGGIAHAVTVWGDANNKLTVTDSDDLDMTKKPATAFSGTQDYSWANKGKSTNQFIYNGKLVTITYVCFLADSSLNNGKPDLFYNPGFGGAENDPPTPELSSGALLLLGMLPVGLAWRRRRKT